jgi:hypothetical protein
VQLWDGFLIVLYLESARGNPVCCTFHALSLEIQQQHSSQANAAGPPRKQLQQPDPGPESFLPCRQAHAMAAASPALAPAFAAAAEAAAAAVSELLALQRALLEQNPAIAEAAEAAEAAAAGSVQDAGSRKRGREGDAAAASGATQASAPKRSCMTHTKLHWICAYTARHTSTEHADHVVHALLRFQMAMSGRAQIHRHAPLAGTASIPWDLLGRQRRTCGGWWRIPLRGGRRTAMRPWTAGTGGRRCRGALPPPGLG